MRVFLAVLVLIFSLQSISKSENLVIDELFGVKILDHIKKYSKIENGVKYDYLKNIITFADEFINIQRTDDFDTYYLRTDTNYKIHNISARKMSLSNINNFSNDCKEKKLKLVKMFTKFFDVKIGRFENFFWIDPLSKTLYDDSSITYKNENINLRLAAYCGYNEHKSADGENMIVSALFVSWVTEEYYINHVAGRWKKIDKFDNKFIKTFLSPST